MRRYGFFGISALIALVFFCYRNELDLCARLFKVSSKALSENWQLMPVNAGFGLLVATVKVGMLSMIVGAVLTFDVIPVGAVGVYACTPQLQDDWHNFFTYGMFIVTWFGFWALETRDYIVGDTIGAWYWHGARGASTTRAVKHAFCSHFGTMAFAGGVMYFVEWLKKKAQYRGNNPLICMAACIARCILSYIEYLCKMSVLMTSITGKSFLDSGQEVVTLFTSSFGSMRASTGVWWIPAMIIGAFVKLASFGFAAMAGYFMYQQLQDQSDSVAGQQACSDVQLPLTLGIGIGVVVLFLMLFLLSFFGQILLTTVDTIYLCFLIDRSKGVVTHQDLHNILSEVIGRRKDVKLRQAQGSVNRRYQSQVVTKAPPAYPQSQQQQFPAPPQQQQYAQQPQFPPVAATPQPRFDPNTGERLSTATSQPQFHPITGELLN